MTESETALQLPLPKLQFAGEMSVTITSEETALFCLFCSELNRVQTPALCQKKKKAP